MDNKEWCVYQHICPNGKVYVGITSQKPKTRWAGGFGYRDNRDFFTLIVKYGWDNIIHQVVHSGLDEDEARQLEKSMIQSLGSTSCNIVFKIEENRNKYVCDPLFDPTAFSVDEMTAIRIWCDAIYGDDGPEHMKQISTGDGWKRTVTEFASGDFGRIAKELVYIDEYRVKRLGLPSRKYTDDEINEIAKKLSGSLMERYAIFSNQKESGAA